MEYKAAESDKKCEIKHILLVDKDGRKITHSKDDLMYVSEKTLTDVDQEVLISLANEVKGKFVYIKAETRGKKSVT